MALFVPQEYKNHVNRVTGVLEGFYRDHNLEALLEGPANRKFMETQLIHRLKDPNVLRRHNSRVTPQMVRKNLPIVREHLVTAMMKKFNTYWRPENKNKLLEVHRINKIVIEDTIENIMNQPQLLDPKYTEIDAGLGGEEGFGITRRAFDGGYYRPHQIFENSVMNQNQAYWIPRKVEWFANPEDAGCHMSRRDQLDHREQSKKGFTNLKDHQLGVTRNTHWVGHKWKYMSKHRDPRMPNHKFNDGMEYPFWQVNVTRRPHKRTSEGLRRGGTDSERNINRNRGYDMSELYKKTSVPRENPYRY